MKCAIGCLIPEDLYNENLEGPLSEFLKKLQFNFAPSQGTRFLTDLQRIHDYVMPKDWEEYLRLFANKYNLIFND